MADRRCGNCAHAQPVPKDLQNRTCKASSPIPIALPAQGGLQIRSFWPMVGVNDSCGQWAERPMFDSWRPPVLGETEPVEREAS